jgi:hypothetical protein
MHVLSASSGCFKSRLSVAHVAMAPVAGEQWPTTGLRLLPRSFLRAVRLAFSSPFPPFSSLYLAEAVRAHAGKRRGTYGPACGRAARAGDSSESIESKRWGCTARHKSGKQRAATDVRTSSARTPIIEDKNVLKTTLWNAYI